MEQDKFVKLLKRVVREVVREEIEMALNKIVLKEEKKIDFLQKSPISQKKDTVEEKKSLMKKLGLNPDDLKSTAPNGLYHKPIPSSTDPIQRMLLETAQEGNWRTFETIENDRI